MLKAELMRQAIVAHQAWFVDNPDSLEVYVTKGNVVAGGGASPSFAYHYELNVLAMDYPGSLDDLAIPVLAWARRHQPALLFNPQRREKGISFDAEILNNDTADILFVINASEMVIVNFDDAGKPVAVHRDEPQNSALFPPDETWSQLIVGDGNDELALEAGNG